MGDWDIESYRSFYESDEHWSLKREFMETHYHAFPEDRLVCLAQVYANIELLGCRYPEKVMEEISYLARGIGQDYKDRKKTKLQRTFVKASDAAGAKVRGTKRQNNSSEGSSAKHSKTLSNKPMMFVKAGSSSEDPQNSPSQTQELVPRDSNFSMSPHLPFKPMAFMKDSSTPEEGNNFPEMSGSNPIMSFLKAARDDRSSEAEEEKPADSTSGPASVDQCLSFIKSFRGETSPTECSSVKTAIAEKADKYKKVVQQNSRQKISFSNSENSSDSSVGRSLSGGNFRSQRGRSSPASRGDRSSSGFNRNDQNSSIRNAERRKYQGYQELLMSSNDPLINFFLVHRLYCTSVSPLSILEDSSRFSGMPIEYQYDKQQGECYVMLNGMQIATGEGANIKAAKADAALEALEALSHRCFTLRNSFCVVVALKRLVNGCIQILKLHSAAGSVALDEVSGASDGSMDIFNGTNKHGGTSLDTPIEDSSVGSKLLKMMGWGGGGLGKDGSGIAEPIRPTTVFGRSGLGHEGPVEQGVTRDFKNAIKRMFRDFMRGSESDIAFSPDFSKPQRAEMHKIARTMGLKSHSHGSGDNRYLIISRKVKSSQLVVQRVLEDGPSDQFEIVPPGGDTN